MFLILVVWVGFVLEVEKDGSASAARPGIPRVVVSLALTSRPWQSQDDRAGLLSRPRRLDESQADVCRRRLTFEEQERRHRAAALELPDDLAELDPGLE